MLESENGHFGGKKHKPIALKDLDQFFDDVVVQLINFMTLHGITPKHSLKQKQPPSSI